MRLTIDSQRATPRLWDGVRWAPIRFSMDYEPSPIPVDRPHPYALPTVAPWEVYHAAITPSYEGSGQMVHPSVLDMTRHGFPNGFNGYRYWMGVTPYPSGINIYENPSVLASNNGWDWHVPHGLTNPIDEKPGTTGDPYGMYNSDTELVWDPEKRRLVLYWRRAFEVIHAAESTDGVHWTNHYRVIFFSSVEANRATMLSPSVVRRGPNDWAMFVIYNRGNHGENDEGTIRLWTAPDPLGPWVEQGQSAPVPYLWHAAVYLEDGQYRMLANRRVLWDLSAGVSEDGLTWRFSEPFLKDDGTYRSTMQPSDTPGMYDVWYSAHTDSQLGDNWWVKHTRVSASCWDNL